MKKTLLLVFLIGCWALINLFSCGKKITRPHELPAGGVIGETTYVQLDPPWDDAHGYDFRNPHKIIIGWDTYIYVADTDNDRILRLDAHGSIRGNYSVPHPVGLTQDELLRLLVVDGISKNIYKIDVGPNGNGIALLCYSWSNTVRNDTLMLTGSDVFTDIANATGYSKRYYVTAATPSILQSGKVVVFGNLINNPTINTTWWRNDTSFTYSVPGFDSIAVDTVLFDYLLDSKYLVTGDTTTNPQVRYGTGIGSTSHPNGITAFRRNNRDYLLITQDSSYFKCQLLVWTPNNYYRLGWYYTGLSGSDNDLHRNNFFAGPSAATIDSAGNIYVVGWGSDSTNLAYKFDSSGKLRMSFGTLGDTTGQLNSPSGIAYDNFANRKTIYIADTGNNRILRFKLSTDIQQ